MCFASLSQNANTMKVQYAGSKDPFMVTVILSCVQLISMMATAITTDKIGRRPLTVYPYAVTSVSVLCLGIVGCFDYTKVALSSLLVGVQVSSSNEQLADCAT
jgi:MFS family permease